MQFAAAGAAAGREEGEALARRMGRA